MLPQFTALLAFVGAATAKYTANLNYRSPSEHHPFMGIAIHKVVKRNVHSSPFDPKALNFTHGVASGDPYPNSVILWTRCSPMYDDDHSNVTVSGLAPLYNTMMQEYALVSTAPVCVNYAVSTSKDMKSVVTKGTAYTSSDIDYTLKVTIDKLCSNCEDH